MSFSPPLFLLYPSVKDFSINVKNCSGLRILIDILDKHLEKTNATPEEFDAAAAYRINCFAIHAISAGLRHIRDIKSTRPLKQAWRSGILHIHVYIFENRSASQSTCFALMIFSINTHKKQMPHPKVWRLFFLWVFTSFRPYRLHRRALQESLP